MTTKKTVARKPKRKPTTQDRVRAALGRLVEAGDRVLVLQAFATTAEQQRWLDAQRAAGDLVRP